ncbi:hypothetical protein V6N11_073773 [Hibiscus sabdariffa]|uniref:RNase H type-1 domain-containing protein n=1 Tax=Hibiscus sabdariffa TaxID=183260 RepID=A0ABR2P4G8_9ROSI
MHVVGPILRAPRTARPGNVQREGDKWMASEWALLLSSPSTSSPYSLIRSIARLINRAWSIDIQVIKREVNSDADHMTKLTLGSDISGLVTDSPSTFLVPILDRHIHDLPYARKARSIPGQAVDIHVTS